MTLTPYQRIVNKLGSQKALAELAEQRQQTVAHWKKAGIIPARHMSRILANAQARGLPLEMSDFFEVVTGDGEAA